MPQYLIKTGVINPKYRSALQGIEAATAVYFVPQFFAQLPLYLSDRRTQNAAIVGACVASWNEYNK